LDVEFDIGDIGDVGLNVGDIGDVGLNVGDIGDVGLNVGDVGSDVPVRGVGGIRSVRGFDVRVVVVDLLHGASAEERECGDQ
jgi:hypothetical protein